MSASETRGAGVLLLGHCAGPLLEPLSAAVAAHGLQPFILTSLPLGGVAARIAALGEIAAWVRCTDAHALTAADVRDALAALRASGREVRCCLSVWEGYRELMAAANGELGVPDLDPGLIRRLLDKLHVRRHLHAHGLSRGTAELVTQDNLAALKASGRKLFLKPVRGLASYGTFPLRASTTWGDLCAVAAGAARDPAYSGHLTGAMRFLAEDFFEGRECSFETLVLGGTPYVVAVHEKLSVTQAATTVLEDADASPPWNIDAAGIGAGVAWLERVFASFGIGWGCFHVEARFDGERWELIEFNPRMGGSTVSDSVAALTGGTSMMELWLAALLEPAAMRERLASLAIGKDGRIAPVRATFSRTYWASPGRIAAIRLARTTYPPALVRLDASAGQEIPAVDREFTLGELLWAYDPADDAAMRAFFAAESEHAIAVEYEDGPGGPGPPA